MSVWEEPIWVKCSENSQTDHGKSGENAQVFLKEQNW